MGVDSGEFGTGQSAADHVVDVGVPVAVAERELLARGSSGVRRMWLP
ncbi:hypothetical protein QFZ82_000022 [Streptomyces sp. V4I23]|nr:hypothetical protein [Streptomyces sp. V4I23]MDQ1005538.1 hypothetical protein [Streptomyces sp. V4I23]